MGNDCSSNFDCPGDGFCANQVDQQICVPCSDVPSTVPGATQCERYCTDDGEIPDSDKTEECAENCWTQCGRRGCDNNDDCDDGEFCSFYWGVPGYCEPCSDGCEGVDSVDTTAAYGCFPPDATAMVKGKGKQLMKDIAVGDQVLTGSGKYSSVYVIDHHHATKATKYLQISTTAEAENPLEITPSHMLFVAGAYSPVPASAIQVGDAIKALNGEGYLNVTGIKPILREGLYNPITTDGTIVVDGLVASTYNAFSANDANIVIGGWKTPVSHQTFLHLYMSPLRALCLGVSSSFCETTADRELHPYSMMGTKMWIHGKKQNGFVQGCVLISPMIILSMIFVLFYKCCRGRKSKQT